MACAIPTLNNQNLPSFTFKTTKTSHSLSFFFFNTRTKPLLPTKPPLNSISSSLFSSPPPQPSQRCHRSITTRVSTTTLECAPPAPDYNFLHKEISHLKTLRSNLSNSNTLKQQVQVIDNDPRVKLFLNSSKCGVLEGSNLGEYEMYLLKCVVAIGQQHVLGEFEVGFDRGSLKSAFYTLAEMIEKWDVSGGGSGNLGEKGEERFGDEEVRALRSLLKILGDVEQFYDCIGGIIGYQIMVLELLAQSTHERQTISLSQGINKSMDCQFLEIHSPNVLDLSHDAEYASQAALWGIEI